MSFCHTFECFCDYVTHVCYWAWVTIFCVTQIRSHIEFHRINLWFMEILIVTKTNSLQWVFVTKWMSKLIRSRIWLIFNSFGTPCINHICYRWLLQRGHSYSCHSQVQPESHRSQISAEIVRAQTFSQETQTNTTHCNTSFYCRTTQIWRLRQNIFPWI